MHTISLLLIHPGLLRVLGRCPICKSPGLTCRTWGLCRRDTVPDWLAHFWLVAVDGSPTLVGTMSWQSLYHRVFEGCCSTDLRSQFHFSLWYLTPYHLLQHRDRWFLQYTTDQRRYEHKMPTVCYPCQGLFPSRTTICRFRCCDTFRRK